MKILDPKKVFLKQVDFLWGSNEWHDHLYVFSLAYEDYMLVMPGHSLETPEELTTLPDNINIYTSVSKVPKGIAKTMPFNFVNSMEDADVLVYDIKPGSSSRLLDNVKNVTFSKKLKIVCLSNNNSLLANMEELCSKLNTRYNTDDFKPYYSGEIYRFPKYKFDEFVGMVKYNLPIAPYTVLQTKYMQSLKPLDEETLKTIYRMILSSDSQSKELGLKMLVQYRPFEYIYFLTYIFYCGNVDICSIRSHSSYINFYADYVYNIAVKESGRYYVRRKSLNQMLYNGTLKNRPSDYNMLVWARDNNLKL